MESGSESVLGQGKISGRPLLQRLIIFSLIINLGILALLLAFVWRTAGPGFIGQGQVGEELELRRQVANSLRTKGLYEQAVLEYVRILDMSGVSSGLRGNVAYTVGTLYQDNLGRSEEAYPYLLIAEHLATPEDLRAEIRRRMVRCLESTGRSVEAHGLLQRATQGDDAKMIGAATDDVAEDDVLVELSDGTKLTIADLDAELMALPPQLREQMVAEPGRKEMLLRSMLARELMYRAALREEFDDRDDIRLALLKTRRAVVSENYYRDKISSPLEPSLSDLKTFYAESAERYRTVGQVSESSATGEAESDNSASGIAPFEELREQVERDWRIVRESEALQALVEELIRAEGAKLFPERLE